MVEGHKKTIYGHNNFEKKRATNEEQEKKKQKLPRYTIQNNVSLVLQKSVDVQIKPRSEHTIRNHQISITYLLKQESLTAVKIESQK